MLNKHPSDKFYIAQALKLAARAVGRTFPNPLVGAVIVKNGKIMGQGFHHKAGLPHAEIAALRDCRQSPKGATLYVNLEPCCHFGRTPPCVDAIIDAGIGRVVFCTLDPNPQVRGRGLKMLKRRGVKTAYGILANEAKKLNEQFFAFHLKKRPFIAIKFAASLDGKIAARNFDSKWITNEAARKFARALRGQYQAVLVGARTALLDNPGLRSGDKSREPLRIILDSKLKLSLSAKIFYNNSALLVTTAKADRRKLDALKRKGIQILIMKKIAVPRLLSQLRQMNIISVLVEGGGEVLGSFVDTKLVDKVYAFHAPLIIGGKNAVSAVAGKGAPTIQNALKLKDMVIKKFGDNTLTTGLAEY